MTASRNSGAAWARSPTWKRRRGCSRGTKRRRCPTAAPKRAPSSARHQPRCARAGRRLDLGELLEELCPFEEEQDPESSRRALTEIARRDYEKAVRVPSELRAELSAPARTATARGSTRASSRLLDPAAAARARPRARRRYVDCFEPTGDPYDVAARRLRAGDDDGGGRGDLRRAEGRTRADDPAVGGATAIDDSCLHGDFPCAGSGGFRSRCSGSGTDGAEDGWRLDRTAHPFATSLGRRPTSA